LASRSNLRLAAIAAISLVGATAPARPLGGISGKVAIAKVSIGSKVDGFGPVVVYLEDAAGGNAAPHARYQIVQHDKRFEPDFLIVPQGAEVAFPNHDEIAHNVFSPVAGGAFDLGIYKRETTRSVKFDKPGIVPIFCNIHPQMIAHVLVMTSGFAVHPGADGSFSLDGVPPGTYHAVAWFPFGTPERREITVAPGQRAELDFTLRERRTAEDHRDKHDQPYSRY
jgi:plastocyanin